MSNKNDDEEEIKNDPLLNDEQGIILKNKKVRNLWFIMIAIILIVIMVIFILLKFTFQKDENQEKNNSFISKYIISEENIPIKLFNYKLIDSISSMKTDNNKSNITSPHYTQGR